MQYSAEDLVHALVHRTNQDHALAMIKEGADVNARDQHGVPIVAIAAALGRTDVYDLLVDRGADLYAIDDSGRSVARHIAEAFAGGRFRATDSELTRARRIAQQLLSNLPAQPEDEVLLTITLDLEDRLQGMIDNGLNPDSLIKGSCGLVNVTVENIQYAAQQAGGLEKAFANGTLFPSVDDLDAQIDGLSLLMWAVAANSTECVKKLLINGADTKIVNSAGVSAFMFASTPRRSHLLELLHISDADRQPTRSARFGIRLETLEEQLGHYRIPEDIGDYYALPNWDKACLLHLMEEDTKRDELLALLAFHGCQHLQDGPKPTTSASNWMTVFKESLSAAYAINNEELIGTLLEFPQRNFYRGERSYQFNPEWFEWPIWQYIAASTRDEAKADRFLNKFDPGSSRIAKAMRAMVQAIADNTPKKATSALERILKAHAQVNEKIFKTTPPECCICLPATILYGYSLQKGVMVDFKSDYANAILPPCSTQDAG